MAKLKYLKTAINTQHQRFQRDYAGPMGVKYRAAMKKQAEEDEKIRQEALADQERLEMEIKTDVIYKAPSLPNDPNWLDVLP